MGPWLDAGVRTFSLMCLTAMSVSSIWRLIRCTCDVIAPRSHCSTSFTDLPMRLSSRLTRSALFACALSRSATAWRAVSSAAACSASRSACCCDSSASCLHKSSVPYYPARMRVPHGMIPHACRYRLVLVVFMATAALDASASWWRSP